MRTLPNVIYKKSIQNPTIDSDNSYYELPYYKDNEYFFNWDNLLAFAVAVEKTVRRSKQYARYIKELKDTVGLTFCQVLSNVDDDKASIEMHHGPILTLFDYVVIVIEHLLYTNKKINTFIVSDIILEEHYNNNIQVVMLSKTMHEEVHEGNIYLNLKHAFGDINTFIKRYRDGITHNILDKINTYIQSSEKHDSFDKNILTLEQCVKKWARP